MKLQVTNLREAILAGEFDYYAERIKKFKSRDNEDVQDFIVNKAEQSCRSKQSVTYLVYNEDTAEIVGYFTLTFKILDIPLAGLSKTLQKDLERNGQRTEGSIQLPGVLLAQWSKNFALEKLISGKVLMDFVEKIFIQIQNLAGGTFIFLECEKDKEHLLAKYDEAYGYTQVSERLSTTGKPLVQLIKKI